MSDEYAWHNAAIAWLKANPGAKDMKAFLKTHHIHDGEPQSGTYRDKNQDGTFSAWVFWKDTNDGSQRCQRDGRDISEQVARERWMFVAKRPITEEVYWHFMEMGQWLDAPTAPDKKADPISTSPKREAADPLPTSGHNSSEEPEKSELETLKEQIEAAAGVMDSYGEIKDEETAIKVKSSRARLNELSGLADKGKEKEFRPLKDAADAVSKNWNPVIKTADEAAQRGRSKLSAWETKKRDEQIAIDRKNAEALQAAVEQNDRAADRAISRGEPEPMPFIPPVETPSTPAPRAQISGGYGRAATVRTIKVVTVTDQVKVYETFKDDPDLKALLLKLAQRATDAGITVPGTTSKEEADVR